jgi:cysteine synthase A
MSIYENITQTIGKTPLVRISRYEKYLNLKAEVYVKLELFNPLGSIKDRIALAMIEDAENKGLLKPGTVIIEPTSGNTGIGLAAVAAVKGYHLILTMPDTMSIERRQILSALGAEIVLTEGSKGMKGAIEKAREIKSSGTGYYMPAQFDNPVNPAIHRKTTGPEIWEDMKGKIDVFVSGIGTGGTITGAGGFLKEKDPNIKIIAVEPAGSPILSKGTAGPHKIQGIGAGFIPSVLDRSIYDEILTVENEDAFIASRLLAKNEGILVGISSGAALSAASKLASSEEYEGKRIVVMLPDTGERYLSTQLFAIL